MGRPNALLTIDLEDYRRQELRDHHREDEPAHPREVMRQLGALLEFLEAIDARATFFSVGRLTAELPPGVWREIADRHRVGCHGHEHLPVRALGPEGFARDLRASKAALEEATGRAVLSYRAPYFSADGCDPWFGATLADEGFALDSSRRLRRAPPGFAGLLPLEGGGGRVWEVPLPAIGYGPKRITTIGGTYLRMIPLPGILALLDRARAGGFIPTVYVHPYDLDAGAEPLDFGRPSRWLPRLGDGIRRAGRSTVAGKLAAIARAYRFTPIEDLLDAGGAAEPARSPAMDRFEYA